MQYQLGFAEIKKLRVCYNMFSMQHMCVSCPHVRDLGTKKGKKNSLKYELTSPKLVNLSWGRPDPSCII